MESSPKPPSRKKFLLLAAVGVCSASVMKLFTGNKKTKTDTVKMLAQDGTLVEVDRKFLGRSGTRISNAELQQWIKNGGKKNKNQKS